MLELILFLQKTFLEDQKHFEKKNKIKIDIIYDNSLVIPEYKIDFKNKSKKTIEKTESLTKLINLKDLKKENNVFSIKKIIKKNKFYKKKFYKKKVK